MFYSQRSGSLSKPGEKSVMVPMAWRPKTYFDRAGNVIGQGSEIVYEIRMTESEARDCTLKPPSFASDQPAEQVILPQ